MIMDINSTISLSHHVLVMRLESFDDCLNYQLVGFSWDSTPYLDIAAHLSSYESSTSSGSTNATSWGSLPYYQRPALYSKRSLLDSLHINIITRVMISLFIQRFFFRKCDNFFL